MAKNYVAEFMADNNLTIGDEFTIQRTTNGALYEDVLYRISEDYFLIDDYGLPYPTTLELLLKGDLCVFKDRCCSVKNYVADFLHDNHLKSAEEFSIEKMGDHLLFDHVRFCIDDEHNLVDDIGEVHNELLVYLLSGKLVVAPPIV